MVSEAGAVFLAAAERGTLPVISWIVRCPRAAGLVQSGPGPCRRSLPLHMALARPGPHLASSLLLTPASSLHSSHIPFLKRHSRIFPGPLLHHSALGLEAQLEMSSGQICLCHLLFLQGPSSTLLLSWTSSFCTGQTSQGHSGTFQGTFEGHAQGIRGGRSRTP